MPDPTNVLLVTIDSLRRDVLSAYAETPRFADYAVATPNLDRFAERAAVFESHYAGSLPCMPARREFTTGTQEFLWRPWGPVEPFDEPLAAAARDAGAQTKLVTDHYHYFESGGQGYYEAFNGFDFVRGHELDAWRTSPRAPDERLRSQFLRDFGTDPTGVERSPTQYARNVADFDELDERDFFAPAVFSRTARWLRETGDWERWFCYVDSFDVHEPFHNPEPYASMYTDEDPRDPDLPVWPEYATVADQGVDERGLEFLRSQFAGKVTMVDRWFGRVLDALDRTGAWADTTVVVTTDHGFVLGEHGWLTKNVCPDYEEVAHTPLLVWHPEGAHNGERVDALTSAVDVYATLADAVGASVDPRHSRSLLPLLRGEAAPGDHRNWALYGYFGSKANVTDGRYTYHRPYGDEPVGLYSSRHMRDPDEHTEAGRHLPYTDDPVWRFRTQAGPGHDAPLLFDVREDPGQERDLTGERPGEATRMAELLRGALASLEAPDEQFAALGLDA